MFWTQEALSDLENIFNYYRINASLKTANRLVKNILKCSLQLEKTPNIGRQEESLKERNKKYRFIVEKNYKIIYWIDNGYVVIASVFDTRQDPAKLNQIK